MGNSIMRFLRISIIVFFALIFVFLFFKKPTYFGSGRQYDHEKNPYRLLMDDMRDMAKRMGVKRTSQVVVTAFKQRKININQCHALFHYLGHTAYELHPNNWDELVPKYVDTCMYGFEHGVVAQITLEKSYEKDEMLRLLHEYCKKLDQVFPGVVCYHGVGHALIQERQPLDSVLKICDEITRDGKEDPNECYRAAFSEDLNTLMGIDGDTDSLIPGVIPIKIESDHAYDRCTTLDLKYQNACVSIYTTFVYDEDLNSSLLKCNRFKPWMADICAFKVSGDIMSNTNLELKTPVPPKVLTRLNIFVREGYIKGVVRYFGQFHDSKLFSDVAIWCKTLELKGDQQYCLSQL